MANEEVRLKFAFDKYGVSREHRASILNYLQILRARDETTYFHSIRVGLLAAEIAKHCGIPGVKPKALLWAGLLHDIGKVLVSPGLFGKSDAFNDADYREMEPHAEYGWRMLRNVHEFTANVIVRHHRFGKRPYPKELPTLPPGLKPKEHLIDACARLLALADFYDALMVRDDGKCGKLTLSEKRDKYLRENSDQTVLILHLEQMGVLKFPA